MAHALKTIGKLAIHNRHSKLGIARYIKNLIVDIAVISIGRFEGPACTIGQVHLLVLYNLIAYVIICHNYY